jgi:hypothetical protein
LPWAAAAAAAAAVVGGVMSSNASKSASAAQGRMSEAALEEQRKEYRMAREDSQGTRARAGFAGEQLNTLLGLNGNKQYEQAKDILIDKFVAAHPGQYDLNYMPSDADVYGYMDRNPDQFKGDTSNPEYGSLLRRFNEGDLNTDVVYNKGLQFGLDQGTGAINARAIQGGGYDSGATLKALTRYANDYGSTKAEGAYNRYTNEQNNTYNKLSGVAGTGQAALNTTTQAGTNMANNNSELLTGIGNSRAASVVGGANAWSNALGQGISGYNNYQTNQNLKDLLSRYNSGSSNSSGSSGSTVFGTSEGE